jgi:signal transduction histidine kinase
MQLSDINAALESTMTVSSSEWKYYASINKNLDAELPLVECVISDINQVVLNMVVNASHAIVDRFDDADTMMGEIGICTRGFEDHISIEIADNGNGMSEEVKSKVFDQFFTTKQVGKGTGQGLSIAHKLIVEKHAGKIEIDSVEGEGTVFRIILPLTQFNSDEDDTNADAVFASATTDARKIA